MSNLYRKKPVVVEAYQWIEKGTFRNPNYNDSWRLMIEWPKWLQEAANKRADKPGAFYRLEDCLLIRTLEGEHIVSDGDWIIQGVQGELYPCKPDIFEATYEAVENGN